MVIDETESEIDARLREELGLPQHHGADRDSQLARGDQGGGGGEWRIAGGGGKMFHSIWPILEMDGCPWHDVSIWGLKFNAIDYGDQVRVPEDLQKKLET